METIKQPMVKWQNQRGNQKIRQMKTETQISKIYGIQQVNSKRKAYSNTGLFLEMRNISNKQPNFPSEEI